MTTESLSWFGLQAVAIIAAVFSGRHLAAGPERLWRRAAVLAAALMLLWPLMRFYPADAVRLLGASTVIFFEVTGIVIPAVILFGIAARHVRQPRERRLVALMLAVCCLYFVRTGIWMVEPPVPDLGPTRFEGAICLQSTGYTCVAASLVTLLKAHSIEATETEMARLSYTEIGHGATDSRAAAALEAKLAGEPIEVRYEAMDYARLVAAPKPCVVPLTFGYFWSHMTPVLAANERRVLLGDPSGEVHSMTTSAFLRAWYKRGIYLLDHRPPRLHIETAAASVSQQGSRSE